MVALCKMQFGEGEANIVVSANQFLIIPTALVIWAVARGCCKISIRVRPLDKLPTNWRDAWNHGRA